MPIVFGFGVTVMLTSVALVTVKSVAPDSPLTGSNAVIVVVPALAVVASPSLPFAFEIVATFVALVVGGIATAGYAALTASNTASEGIGCHAGGKPDGGATIVGLDGRRATATCAALWSSGQVVAGEDRPPGDSPRPG